MLTVFARETAALLRLFLNKTRMGTRAGVWFHKSPLSLSLPLTLFLRAKKLP